jgi:hypothetical protein
MPDSSGQEIKEQYDAGIRGVQGVLFSLDSTPDQQKVAEQTLKDLTTLLLDHTIKDIEGRTALLKGLIAKLNQVIASIQTTPPLQALAQRLTGVVGKSTTLLTNVKTDFLAAKK